ncbi:hypothetical protein FFONT_0997 [Fervidicoccus fontis Kam940]|uniref:2-thiouridine synthetase TtuA-like N-terminal LIM domain-containing protein n=2 Tax=Fervidicoccus fontis TaxID=683846 RepID=I0A1X8_FERFK|nr:hypothetical protein FFONT_0997 [Fervidicoccus fontis Kam940]
MKLRKILRSIRNSHIKANCMKCTKCGKKEAIFKVPYTNYFLCADCYSTYFYKRLKRNLSRSNVLSYGGKLSVFVPRSFTAEGLVLIKILRQIERKYNNKLTVIFESSPIVRKSLSVLGKLPSEVFYSLEIVDNEEKDISHEGMLGRLRVVRGMLSLLDKNITGNAIVLPLCQDVLILLELSSILGSIVEGINEGVLVISSSNGTNFINAFSGISCYETSFMAYYNFPEIYEFQIRNLNYEKNIYEKYTERILTDASRMQSGEVIFSVNKSLSWLYKERGSMLKKCKYCGGTSSSEVCRFCKTYLDMYISEKNTPPFKLISLE